MSKIVIGNQKMYMNKEDVLAFVETLKNTNMENKHVIVCPTFPFLEYYTCTDVEKEALESKIKYESMTVMRIGTLEEFMTYGNGLSYFKGALIRADEIADDSHIVESIYEELLKGVYI